MATFVVCSKCRKVQETEGVDQIPTGWQRSDPNHYCTNCADTSVLDVGAAEDVLADNTLDEGYCAVCKGPCQGH